MDKNAMIILFWLLLLASFEVNDADQDKNDAKVWPTNNLGSPKDNDSLPSTNNGKKAHDGNHGDQGGNPESHWSPAHPLNNKNCIENIYSRCNLDKIFTQQQLENVRQFLFQTFTNRAEVKPENNLCPKLRIRRNWKCLSDEQRDRTIDVWQQMYSSGIIAKFTDKYSKNWATWHKSPELLFALRRLTNQFEQAMMAIDPRVTLPYWEPWQYATHAEFSTVWGDLGTAGNYEGGYCVEDGFFSELLPCLKRHWSPRGAIYPYSTPEFITEIIENSKGLSSISMKLFSLFYQHSVSIGGYEGQLSTRDGPYDPIFWMSWAAISDLVFLRWQLQGDANLCPMSYDIASIKFNQNNSFVEGSDMLNDTITGIPSSSIRENCWLGFGDLCYIPDQLINVIDLIYTKQKDPTCPVAVQRIKAKPWLAAKYFPKMYIGNVSRLDHVFEEVGECNSQCDPISKPTYLVETETGRKVAEEFAYDLGIDLATGGLSIYEQSNYQLWLDLNRAGYCSPYVTR